MNETDAARMGALQARIAAGQAAIQCARGDLIERLGDHMCGAPGDGPTRADLKALAQARRTTRQAQNELAELLTRSALATFGRRPASVQTSSMSQEMAPKPPPRP